MLAKLTSKNQLTLPKSVVQALGMAEYFDVEVRDGQLVLTPVRIQRADAVRAKLAALGLDGGDVTDAVRWARAGGAAGGVAEGPGRYPVRKGRRPRTSGRKPSRK